MLILSRKAGQDILIGDNVRVTVLSIKGNRIRLGITAPTEMCVLRAELSPVPAAGLPGTENLCRPALADGRS
jgi:carbon storage regulator